MTRTCCPIGAIAGAAGGNNILIRMTAKLLARFINDAFRCGSLHKFRQKQKILQMCGIDYIKKNFPINIVGVT